MQPVLVSHIVKAFGDTTAVADASFPARAVRSLLLGRA